MLSLLLFKKHHENYKNLKENFSIIDMAGFETQKKNALFASLFVIIDIISMFFALLMALECSSGNNKLLAGNLTFALLFPSLFVVINLVFFPCSRKTIMGLFKRNTPNRI